MRLVNRRSSISTRIHIRKFIILDLDKVFTFKFARVCVHVHKSLEEQLFHIGKGCSFSLRGNLFDFSGKLDVVTATMSNILKLAVEQLINFSMDVVKFDVYDKNAPSWLHIVFDVIIDRQDKLLWLRMGKVKI